MKDLMREKFLRLMTRIEELEEGLSELEKKEKEEDSSGAASLNRIRESLKLLQEELNEKRRELARISDGCGKPHNP